MTYGQPGISTGYYNFTTATGGYGGIEGISSDSSLVSKSCKYFAYGDFAESPVTQSTLSEIYRHSV